MEKSLGTTDLNICNNWWNLQVPKFYNLTFISHTFVDKNKVGNRQGSEILKNACFFCVNPNQLIEMVLVNRFLKEMHCL